MSHSASQVPAPKSEYKFNQTLILIPFIAGASLLAFFTTSDGFSRVLTGGVLYTIVSYTMSAFLVAVASFCSYQLGAGIANWLLGRGGQGRFGNRGFGFFILAFMLTASASGLFSYTFWHEQFYKLSAQGIDARELPKKLAQTIVMPKVDADIDAALGREANAITDTPDVRDWINSGPNALVQLAGAGGGNFDAALRAAAEKAAEDAHKRAKTIDDLTANIKKLDAEGADLTRQLDALQKALSDPAAEPALLAARATAEAEKQAAEAAKNGADSSKVAACGPICLEHVKAQKAAEKEVARLTSALKSQFEQRAKLQKTIADKKSQRDAMQAQVDSLKRQGGGDSALTGADATAAPIRALQGAVSLFAHDPRKATLETLSKTCASVLSVAQAAFPGRDDVAKIDCQYNGMEGGPKLQARQAHLDAWADWKKGCDASASLDQEGGLPARIQKISDAAKAPDAPPGQSLQDARKVVEGCVDRLPAIGVAETEVSALHSTIEEFVANNSLERNEFERSLADLRAFTPAARAGLLISAFIELAILIFKALTDIVAAKLKRNRPPSVYAVVDANDDPAERMELRVYKALYRNLRSVGGDSDEILDEDIEGDDVAPELRQGVRTLIARIARTGMARRRGKGYRIDHEAIATQIDPVIAQLAAEAPAPKPQPTRQPFTEAPHGAAVRRETTRTDLMGSAPTQAPPPPPVDDSGQRQETEARAKTLNERLREQLASEFSNPRRR